KLYNVLMSIDDFGKAYTSLARFRDLPFVELKLDRKFVNNCSSDAANKTLCQSVIDFAHHFGASVCAEGVETTHDLRALIEMNCDMAQGFLFAKPCPMEVFKATLPAPATQTNIVASQGASRI